MRSLVGVAVSLVALTASAQSNDIPVETAAVQSRMSAVKMCWERVWRAEPTPSKAMLAIEVDPEGAVTRVTADPLPQRLVECIAGRMRTLRFPTGAVRQLVYPLVLVTPQ